MNGILLVEDNQADALLIQEALRQASVHLDVERVPDGEAALRRLRNGPRPGLVLLDLNLPRMDGRTVLAELKADPDLHTIPVIVLTTSRAEEDVFRTYDLGVSSFITKPVTFAGLVEAMKVLAQYWFEIVELPNGATR